MHICQVIQFFILSPRVLLYCFQLEELFQSKAGSSLQELSIMQRSNNTHRDDVLTVRVVWTASAVLEILKHQESRGRSLNAWVARFRSGAAGQPPALLTCRSNEMPLWSHTRSSWPGTGLKGKQRDPRVPWAPAVGLNENLPTYLWLPVCCNESIWLNVSTSFFLCVVN